MADIAHINAFVSSGLMNNPFEHCDIVTTTTHKALRGPRAGLIFYRKNLEKQINSAVFPGLQGGPHQNQIAAVAYQLKECMSDEFKQYSKQVLLNAKALAKCFIDLGYDIVTGGTDNHLFLIKVGDGNKIEKMLEEAEIFVNKNTVPGDTSAMKPSGIRIGTCAITTMGMREQDMSVVATFIHLIIKGEKIVDRNSVIEYIKQWKSVQEKDWRQVC
jgi:glycine hydroxymethyltransferase